MAFKSGDIFFIKVIPNSSRNEIEIGDEIKVHIKAPPEDNKANSELIKFFKKKYKLNIQIISGKTSRKKKIKID